MIKNTIIETQNLLSLYLVFLLLGLRTYQHPCTREVRAGFYWGNLEERDHLEGVGIDERIILTWVIKK
jgi:hypothetical protein